MKKCFLIATYISKPRDPSMTSVAGYLKDEKNVKFDEQVLVAKKVKPNELSTASVVLDLVNERVVKNRYNNDATYVSLLEYYMRNYEDYIKNAISAL